MEKRSYAWFEKRRRTKGLELAHNQIAKAFDTVILLHKATKSFSEGNLVDTRVSLQTLYSTEEEVDFTIKAVTDTVHKLREMSPLWEMYKEGIDLNSIEWAAH